jgi:hypothetical protein
VVIASAAAASAEAWVADIGGRFGGGGFGRRRFRWVPRWWPALDQM